MCRNDSRAAMFAAYRGRRKPSGFSLLDVVVVVVIVAILATIALPSYRHAMLKTRRAEGRALLQVVMAAEERYYATYNRYAATLGGEGISAAAESSPGRYYAVSSLDLADDGQLVVVTVEPRGAQSGDPCGKLTLDSLGRRGAAGAADPDDCR